MDPASPTKQELIDAYQAALAFALRVTKSKARADDVVQDAVERLLTTRAGWDRDTVPLDAYLIGIVRSLLSNARRSTLPRKVAAAQEGFHDEVVGRHTASPEDRTLAHAESAERQTDAATELELLTTSVADYPVPLGVLHCRAEGLDKASEIAAKLRVPVDDVYRANEMLRLHLKKIRERK
jgi:RNA polymerase sigma factor (sigma-70 family)